MNPQSVEAVSVVGLGKLGSCLAATFSNAGFRVVGADLDEAIVEMVDAREAPQPEPLLAEYLSKNENDIRTTTDTMTAVKDTDVTFIAVNTPSTEDGKYALDAVKDVCHTIGEALAEKDDYHVVVLTSTVFPGATTNEVLPAIESASGLTAGEDFGLCYSPEFIAIGNVIRGLEDPDFFIVGEHSERAGDVVESIYGELGDSETPVVRVSPIDAEVIKMTVNSYVTMKISFANTLGEVCEGVGADVDSVTDAITMDSRINGEYLSAGGRFGGPCFPRDNVAFSRLAEEAGTSAPLAESTDTVNHQHSEWIAEAVKKVTADGESIGILGMTYKPGTYIVTESQGVALVAELRDDHAIHCHDPMGIEEARAAIGDEVTYHESMQELLSAVDSVVVTVPWDEYTDEEPYQDADVSVVDPWRLFDRDDLEGVEYVPLGNGRNRRFPLQEPPSR